MENRPIYSIFLRKEAFFLFSAPTVASLLRDLHTASGLRVSIHDTEFNELAACPESLSGFCEMLQQNPKARLHCLFTDRDTFERVRHTGKIHLYKCRFGLWEAACPLYRNGVLVGYLMMGQGRDVTHESEQEILSASLPYTTDAGELTKRLQSLPALSKETATAFSHIMTLCAEHIASLTAVSVPTADLTEAIIRYINRNIGKKLTVAHLCAAFHCSKSTLMNLFRKNCGMTLGDYLTDRRMAIARELLQYTEEPIGVVALKCGFPDQGYFSKVFSATVGCSPTAYRRDPFRK